VACNSQKDSVQVAAMEELGDTAFCFILVGKESN